MENGIYKIIKVIFYASLTAILFILLFFQNADYLYNISFLLSNLSIAVLAPIFRLLAVFGIKEISQFTKNDCIV